MIEIHWAQQAAYPVLGALQLMPLIGAALILWVRAHRLAVPLARLLALAELLLAVDLLRHLDASSPALQLGEQLTLLGAFGYHAAADGVTVLFVLLAALLTFLVTLYGPVRKQQDPGAMLGVVLAVQAVLMSLLVTVNLLWFVLASAIELGLVGYLLWRWATAKEKGTALARFYQFQGTGLLLLILGTLMLGWHYADATGAGWSFELAALSAVPVDGRLATIIFFLLFFGLAIRTPLFPFHGWLPVVLHHGNVAVAPTFLLGVKVGIYGMVRFVFPILPDAVIEWHAHVVAFAVFGVFYAAFLAFLQVNLRPLMAYAVISHTSLVVVGLYTLHLAAFEGAVLLAVNFGLAATAMMFMIGFVYQRTHTTALARLGGLFDRIPLIGVAFLVAGLAIVGMPGTPGFDAAHLVLEAGIARFGALLTVAAALGNVLAAGFLLWAFQRAFLAPPVAGGKALAGVAHTTATERLVVFLVLLVLLGTGFYLEPWLELVEPPLRALSERLGQD